MTELEKKLMNMSPAERKKAVAHISDQMGMPSKKAKSTTKTAAKKTTKKK